VVQQLEIYPKLQYKYLQGIIERANAARGGASNDAFDDVVRGSQPSSGIRVSEREHERYIELMAELEPSKLYPYLISNNTYRLDFALRVCERHGIVDGSSYLKERTGDVSGALTLITKVRMLIFFYFIGGEVIFIFLLLE
jgi:hypothetical protein